MHKFGEFYLRFAVDVLFLLPLSEWFARLGYGN
jgi:hypothetical protein